MPVFESGLVKSIVRRRTPNSTGIKIYVKDTVIGKLYQAPMVRKTDKTEYMLELILSNQAKLRAYDKEIISEIIGNIKDIINVSRNIALHFNCSLSISGCFNDIEDRNELFLPVVDNIEITHNGENLLTAMHVDEIQKYYDSFGEPVKIVSGISQRIPSDVPCFVEVSRKTNTLIIMPNKDENYDLRNTTLSFNFDYVSNDKEDILSYSIRRDEFGVNYTIPRYIRTKFVGSFTKSMNMPVFFMPNIEISEIEKPERLIDFVVSNNVVVNLERFDEILYKFKTEKGNRIIFNYNISSVYKVKERLLHPHNRYLYSCYDTKELFKRISYNDFIDYLERVISVLLKNNMTSESFHVKEDLVLVKSDKFRKYVEEIR